MQKSSPVLLSAATRGMVGVGDLAVVGDDDDDDDDDNDAVKPLGECNSSVL